MTLERQPQPEITEITIAAARAGDHAAIGAVAGEAFRRIVAFYRYTGASVDLAEDLAADAVETIIAQLPSLKKVKSYDAWMWAIARNRLRDHWRRRRHDHSHEPRTPAPLEPDELVVLDEEHAAIRAAIGRLSLRDQELLWLREVVGLEYATIARRVGISSATARVATHRARRNLQAAYDQQFGHEESSE